MFDGLALRRAKAMLVRQGAVPLLHDATEALHSQHRSTCNAYQQGLICRHVSSRKSMRPLCKKPCNAEKTYQKAVLVFSGE